MSISDVATIAMAGYSAMKKRKYEKELTQTRDKMFGSGYHGRSLILKKPVKAKSSKYDLYGSRGEDETFGTISRPEMAYLGFCSLKATSYPDGDAAPTVPWSGSVKYHVAAALLRKNLKRHFQCDISDHSQHITVGSMFTGDGSIQYPSIYFIAKVMSVAQNATLPSFFVEEINLGSVQSTIGALSGPKQFGFVAMEIVKRVFNNPEFGGITTAGSADRGSLYGYTLSVPMVHAAGANGAYIQNGDVYRLDEEYMKAYSVAELMVQNVTVSDNAVGEVRSMDRIDSNPLSGRLFKFSTAFPQIAHSGVRVQPSTFYLANPVIDQNNYIEEDQGYRLMTDSNGDGMIVPNAALLHSWTQLPAPSFFKKCSGVASIKMPPGSMQKYTLKFKFDGKLIDFIRGTRVRVQIHPSRSPIDEQALGTSCMIALEKSMSTGTDTNVTVNYQLSYWAGAVMKKSKRHPIRPYNKSCWMLPGIDASLQGTFVDNEYTGAADT